MKKTTKAGKAPRPKLNDERTLLKSLPPEVDAPLFGRLFIEMHKLDWLSSGGVDYLRSTTDETGAPGPSSLYAHFRFWGDSSPGLYLR